MRFSCALAPNATTFSKIMPVAVGATPFQSADTPSLATMARHVDQDVAGTEEGEACSRTLTVSKGCPT
jgi:hypothetical protein